MASPEGPSVAGIVLAAGASTRFDAESSEGPRGPKQLALFEGEPLLRRVCRLLAATALQPLVVVLGHEAERVRAAISGLDVTVIENPDFASGQASSVRRGLEALQGSTDAAIFVPADQPFIDADLIEKLIGRHTTTGKPIVVPRCGARRGAPVLFARSQFDDLRGLEGDEGGRQLLRAHPERCTELELSDERPLLDIDTVADLEDLRLRSRT